MKIHGGNVIGDFSIGVTGPVINEITTDATDVPWPAKPQVVIDNGI